MFRLSASVAGLLIVLTVAGGCAKKELLMPHSATAPYGVDFSGTWVIREEESASQVSINRAVSQTTGSGRRTSSRNRGGSSLVHVFLETGKRLKITQTTEGFFVSLDRSVVEEFRFGESRTISVGQIEAERVSGWDGAVYTVQTLDKKGMKLTDRFWLSDDKKVLLREITFRNRKKNDIVLMQFFDRAR